MIFSVENGSFAYKKEEILTNLSFSVESGEILAILGSNGVGKTTLLRCMMGLLPWKSGRSTIDGRPINEFTSRQLWRILSYVPQARGASFAYTAREMVLLGRSAHLDVLKQPKQKDLDIVERSMEEVGIIHLAEKKCTQMSGGELQMVLIARALTAEPQLLVLDEPESNLDFKNQLIILDTIRRLAKEKHISTIINTHYPDHALKLSDKALLLQQPGENKYGATAEIINEENMRCSFGVNVSIPDFCVDGIRYNAVVPLSIVS
ncbi:MAG: ABC transporter ATP-binding protein [Clostridiales bacterium]|nr:ABC transporter ATP-binding protein [Clostridiales bacterium]